MSASDPADLRNLLSEREWVRRVARALAGRIDAADDMEQDAWLAAMRTPPRSEATMRAWFRSVLRRRVALDARTDVRRRRREESVARPEAQPSAEEIVARAEAHRAVVEAVFSLAEPWRTTVVLRYFQDLTPNEIGERLGVPADTVRGRLRHAHEDLRRRLAPRGDRRDAAWLPLLALPTRQPFPGGTLVAGSASKAAVVVGACLLVLGAALWSWESGDGRPQSDRGGVTGGTSDAGESLVESPARTPVPQRGPAEVQLAATPDPTRASVSGDVRFVVGDRAAPGVVVELHGPKETLRATTDAAGAFHIESIRAGGPFTAVATHAGFAPARLAGLRVEQCESRRLDTLWLDEPLHVDVRVVAPDGSPVEGASVEAFRERTRIERQDWGGPPSQPEAAQKTDAVGHARFDDLSVGSWTFRGVHPDFASSGAGPIPILRGGVARDVVLRLEPGHPLTGVITSNEGSPLADAVVRALPPVEAPLLMDPKPLDPLRAETRTDAAGRYLFRALSTGEHSLAIVLPGTLPARVGVVSIPSVSHFDVRLDGAVLKGRVTEDGTGRPIEGARVRAAVWRSHSPTFLTALTDADGRYAVAAPLGGILQGPARGEQEASQKPVHFDVEKEGFAFAPELSPTPWRNVWVFGAKDTDYDVVMRPAASLSGAVTGPEGPVAGAEVVADVWSSLRGSLPSRATTGPDGRYRFSGLPQGKARLVVTRPGYFQTASPGGPWRTGPAPDAGAVVEIPARGAATLDVRLERGATLRGRVADGAGAPVTAAEVACECAGEPARHAATDASGAFDVAGLRPGAEVSLRVSRDGYADAESKTTVSSEPDGASATVAIVMDRAGAVRGRVVGPNGQAVPGAVVQIAPAKLALDSGYEVVGVWQHADRHPVAADGSFEAPIAWFGGAAAEGVVARASAPGLAPAISERLAAPKGAAADAGTLKLEAGHRLEGRVVAADGSGPVAGAQIEFQNERLPPALAQRRDWSGVGRDMTPFEVVARTDADGRFAVDGLPPWRYELRVNGDGFGDAAPTVAVPQDEPVVIELPRLAPLAGRVEFEDGAPGAQIVVIAHWTNGTPGMAGFSETSADGSFELPFLPTGRYVLEARRPADRVLDVVPTTTPPVDGGTRDVKIVVKRGGGRISGRCVTSDGAAVPGAVLYLKPVAGGSQLFARSAPDGRFDASGLADGTWTITAQADRSVGGPESFGRRIVTDAVDAAVGARDVTLEFRPAAPISGRVVREDGAALAGNLMVQARRGADARWSHLAPVETDGAFNLAGTSAGTWTLAVVDRHSGASLKTSGAVEFAGGSKDVRVVVQSSSALGGRVLDEHGRGVAGAHVVARAAGAAAVETVSDVEGRFTWTGLAAGPWTVEAFAHETGRADAAGLAPGGADVSLTLRPSEIVAARIVASDGSPVRGAEISLAVDSGAVVARLRTDAEGRFVTRALSSGEYVVAVTTRDGKPLDPPAAAGRVRSGAPETVLRM